MIGMQDGLSGLSMNQQNGNVATQNNQNQMMGQGGNIVPASVNNDVIDLSKVSSFGEAFKQARSMGASKFRWKRNMSGNDVYDTGIKENAIQRNQFLKPDPEVSSQSMATNQQEMVNPEQQKAKNPGLLTKIFKR